MTEVIAVGGGLLVRRRGRSSNRDGGSSSGVDGGVRGSVRRWIRILALPLLCGGCSTLRRPPPVVDRSQDDRILSEVTSRIHAEPELSTRDIRIEVDAAIVRLYGGVAGMGEWRCALRNAQQVSGVLTVVDYLMIEPGPPTSRCLARPSSESIP